MTESLPDAPPRTDWRALAAQLGVAFAARAAALDAIDGFAAENVTELKASHVYAAAVPAELGGGDATMSELSELLREMARHCPATALMLAMHTHNVAVAAWRWRHQNAPTDGLLRRVAAEQCVLISTGGNDWLGSSGTATKVDGGYRIDARKPFSSGQPVGDLINTSAVLDDPAEGPLVLHFMVPVTAVGVRILETWKTLGMRASGSNDILLEGVFVPDAAIGARRPKGVWNPLFHAVAMVAFPLVYSVYLGVAEAARDPAVTGVPDAARRDPFVQVAVGAMDTTLATARMAVADMIGGRRRGSLDPRPPTASSPADRSREPRRSAPWSRPWNWRAGAPIFARPDWSGCFATCRQHDTIRSRRRISNCWRDGWHWVCRLTGDRVGGVRSVPVQPSLRFMRQGVSGRGSPCRGERISLRTK